MQKTRKFWNEEKCIEEFKKFYNLSDFRKNNLSAYKYCQKNNLLKKLKTIEKQKITKEYCEDLICKYSSLYDFKEKHNKIYNICLENKWEDLFLKIINIKKPNNYWSKEKCYIESLKYNTIKEFSENNNSVYQICCKNKWLDVCSHLTKTLKSKGYWTEEKCQEEALKYNTKTEFAKNSSTAYNKSLEMNYLDKFCSHMIKLGDRKNRCIYAYEFNDNHVYIGLTYNIEKRNKKHTSEENSTVYKYINQSRSEYVLVKLTDYIDIDNAIKLEGEYVEK